MTCFSRSRTSHSLPRVGSPPTTVDEHVRLGVPVDADALVRDLARPRRVRPRLARLAGCDFQHRPKRHALAASSARGFPRGPVRRPRGPARPGRAPARPGLDRGGSRDRGQVRRVHAPRERVHGRGGGGGGGPAAEQRHGGFPAGAAHAARVPAGRGARVPERHVPHRAPTRAALGAARRRRRRRVSGGGRVEGRTGRRVLREPAVVLERGEGFGARPGGRDGGRVVLGGDAAEVLQPRAAERRGVPERPDGVRGGAGQRAGHRHARGGGAVRRRHARPRHVPARRHKETRRRAAVQEPGVRRARRGPGAVRVAGQAADA